MQIINVKPEFVTKEIKSKKQLYRFDKKGGNRQYFTISDDGTPRFYPSVTTILSTTESMPYALRKMLGEMGVEKYNQYMGEAAHKGTLIHAMISEYLKNKEFDFDKDFEQIFYEINSKSNYPVDFYTVEIELKKKLASLIKFAQDTNLKPVAIEWQGVYDSLWSNPDVPELYKSAMFNSVKFAGTVDLICYLDVEVKFLNYDNPYKSGKNKGEPRPDKRIERKLAIVDFKSGGIYEGMADQLLMYKMIVEASTDLKVDYLLNVAPKDWRSTPSYTVKDQTDESDVAKIYHKSMLYSYLEKPNNDILEIKGKVNGSDVSQNISWIDVNDFVKTLNKVSV